MYYGKKVILRSLELEDVDRIMINWNNLELRRTLGSQLPNTRQEEIEWVKQTWERRKKGIAYAFAITTMKGKFIGTVGLFAIDKTSRSARLGIAIHEKENRRKGYGSDALLTICSFGFNILNLNRIQLEYIDGNPGAKMYYKYFKEVGRCRQQMYVLGEYKDLIYMDLLRDEFFDNHSNYNLFKSSEK